MFNELSITIGKQDFITFFQGGFYNPSVYLPYLHRHNYTEIHLVTGGNAEYVAGDESFCANDGQMIVIPRNILHFYINGPNKRSIAPISFLIGLRLLHSSSVIGLHFSSVSEKSLSTSSTICESRNHAAHSKCRYRLL